MGGEMTKKAKDSYGLQKPLFIKAQEARMKAIYEYHIQTKGYFEPKPLLEQNTKRLNKLELLIKGE